MSAPNTDSGVDHIIRKLQKAQRSRDRLPMPGLQANLQHEKDALTSQLGRALERAEHADTPEAGAALKATHEEADCKKLIAFLKTDAAKSVSDLVERNREIAAVAFLVDNVSSCEEALSIILAEHPDDLESLNRLGHVLYVQGDLQEAKKTLKRVWKLAKEPRDKLWLATAAYNLSRVLGDESLSSRDYSKATRLLFRALALFSKLGHLEDEATVSVALWVNQGGPSGTKDSDEYALRALEIYGQLGDRQDIAVEIAVVGRVMALFEPEGARKCFRMALAICEKLNDREGLARLHTELGELHHRKDELDKAGQHYREALRIYEELGDHKRLAGRYLNLCALCADMDDFDQAVDLKLKALKVLKGLDGNGWFQQAEPYLRETYWGVDRLDKAQELQLQLLDSYEQRGERECVAVTYANLCEIYYLTGDLGKAVDSYLKAIELSKELKLYDSVCIQYRHHPCEGHPDYLEDVDLEKTTDFYSRLISAFKERGDHQGIASVNEILARVYGEDLQEEKKREPEKAEEYYLKSIETYDQLSDRESAAIICTELGTMWYRTSGRRTWDESLDKARQYHLKALGLCEECGNRKGMAKACLNLGRAYDLHKRRPESEDINRAEEYTHKALALYEELNDREGMADAHLQLGEIYQTGGPEHRDMRPRKKKADEHLRKALALYKEVRMREKVCEVRQELRDLHPSAAFLLLMLTWMTFLIVLGAAVLYYLVYGLIHLLQPVF